MKGVGVSLFGLMLWGLIRMYFPTLFTYIIINSGANIWKLFFDTDGTVYLSSTYRTHTRTPVPTGSKQLKDFGIHICTVDLETGTPTSKPRLIRSSDSGVSEGSHIFKRGKYYYLFTAEGGTESGHCEWVFRSEDGPFGPWVPGPVNPLWRNGVDDEIQNTGHADFVVDEGGRWWGVFLGVRPVWREMERRWEESVFGILLHYHDLCFVLRSNGGAGRETFLVPVDWVDDWPVVNSGKKIALQNNSPHLYEYSPPVEWRDGFTSPTMQLGWYRKNTPVKKDYTLLSTLPGNNNGGLRLHGAPYTLSTPACPTLFLRKQTHRFCVWETRLKFSPDSVDVEAGTAVYLNYYTHASIGIRLPPASESGVHRGKRIIRFTPTNTGPETQGMDVPLVSPDSDVMLRIECGDAYRFGFREVLRAADAGFGETHWVGEVRNRDLVEAPLPVGAPFTGVMLGLYSCGDREAVLTPADFAYAEVTGLD